MAFSPSDKEQVVEGLIAARRQAQLAELSLRSQGQNQQADNVRAATAALSTKIDALIAAMMRDWLGQVAQVIGDLKARTSDLEKAVDQIKKQVEIAQTVVKVIGFVDQAVAIAAKVLAA
jgi:hypothetical protein